MVLVGLPLSPGRYCRCRRRYLLRRRDCAVSGSCRNKWPGPRRLWVSVSVLFYPGRRRSSRAGWDGLGAWAGLRVGYAKGEKKKLVFPCSNLPESYTSSGPREALGFGRELPKGGFELVVVVSVFSIAITYSEIAVSRRAGHLSKCPHDCCPSLSRANQREKCHCLSAAVR